MSQGLHQSSASNTSGQGFLRRTSLPSGLLATDWNTSWLPNNGFASPSITSSRPFVKTYSPSSWPGITFYQLPRPDSHVASDVVLCVIKSMFFSTSNLAHLALGDKWRAVYSRCLERFELHSQWTLIIRTDSSAFVSLDGVSLFVGLLLITSSRYIAWEVIKAEPLQPFISPTSHITLPKWKRLVIKRQPSNTKSNVRKTTSPLHLSFSAHDETSTLYLYLDDSISSSEDLEPIIAVVHRLLSLDAMILLDDVDVKETYASLVVQLLPALLGEKRLFRLRGLPVVHSVFSLCVKQPAALVLDFSSPDAIKTFVYRLPRILTSIPDERRAQPLRVYLCFKYDAVVDTKDPALWSYLENILARRTPVARIIVKRFDAIENVSDSVLEARLTSLMPIARERVRLT